jgi:phytoene dehydrogenase-like protein
VVDDDDQPFVEGNHIFVSISARNDGHAPAGLRAATVSTHVALQTMRTDDVSGTIAAVNGIQARMADVLGRKAPELRIRASMTASPRTWKRFVGRSEGAVGGPPRVAGLASYRDVGAQSLSPDHPQLWLVGDSVFPGQSILATAVGGERLARVVLKHLGHEAGRLRSESPRGAS